MQDEVFCFEEREEGDGYSIYSVQAQYRQMRDAVIPSAYDGRPVVAIDEGAFDSMETLESVEIPDSVTHIGDMAFVWCSRLKRVKLGGAKDIGKEAFAGCNALEQITIPATTVEIGAGVLNGCNALKTIEVEAGNPRYHSKGNCLIETKKKALLAGCPTSVIPDDGSVTEIAESAFVGLPLRKAVHIPASVTEIADGAFCGLAALETITVERRNRRYRSDGNCLIENDSDILILGCNTSVIPQDVREIGNHAFFDCAIEKIELPRRLRSIGDSAFRDCTCLTELVIPEGVTSIGEWAFSGCRKLQKITLPQSLTQIDDWAFGGVDRLSEIVYLGNKKQWKAIHKHPDWLPIIRTPIELFARGLFGKSKKIGVLTDSPFKGLRK